MQDGIYQLGWDAELFGFPQVQKSRKQAFDNGNGKQQRIEMGKVNDIEPGVLDKRAQALS